MWRHATRLAAAALAAAVLVTLVACSPEVTSTNGALPGTVTAIGTGTGAAAPDRVQMSFGVTFEASTTAAASDGASRIESAVIDALRAAGVSAGDVQSTQITLGPHQTPNGTTSGYDANQTVSVDTGLVDKAGAIAAAATGAGATEVSGPQFSISDRNPARLVALTKAMADARARADAMARATDRELGEVVSITEAPLSSPIPLAAAAAPSAGGVTPPTVEPGTILSQAQVTVVFGLR